MITAVIDVRLGLAYISVLVQALYPNPYPNEQQSPQKLSSSLTLYRDCFENNNRS